MGTRVIAHGNPAPVFQFREHPFDSVALLVERLVALDGHTAVLATGMHGSMPLSVGALRYQSLS